MFYPEPLHVYHPRLPEKEESDSDLAGFREHLHCQTKTVLHAARIDLRQGTISFIFRLRFLSQRLIGAHLAAVFVTNCIAEGDLDRLSGLVTTEAIEEIAAISVPFLQY